MRFENRLENPYEAPKGVPMDLARAREIGTWMRAEIHPALGFVTSSLPMLETNPANTHDASQIREDTKAVESLASGLLHAKRIRFMPEEVTETHTGGGGTEVEFSFYDPTQPDPHLPIGTTEITDEMYRLVAGMIGDVGNNTLAKVRASLELMEYTAGTKPLREILLTQIDQVVKKMAVFNPDNRGVKIEVTPTQQVDITGLPKEKPKEPDLVLPARAALKEDEQTVEHFPIPTRPARLIGQWLSDAYARPLSQVDTAVAQLEDALGRGLIQGGGALEPQEDTHILRQNTTDAAQLLAYLGGAETVEVVETHQGKHMIQHTFPIPEQTVLSTPVTISEGEEHHLDAATTERFLLALRHHFVNPWDGLRFAQYYATDKQRPDVAAMAETIAMRAAESAHIIRSITDGYGEIEGMTIRVENGVITPTVQRKAPTDTWQ